MEGVGSRFKARTTILLLLRHMTCNLPIFLADQTTQLAVLTRGPVSAPANLAPDRATAFLGTGPSFLDPGGRG